MISAPNFRMAVDFLGADCQQHADCQSRGVLAMGHVREFPNSQRDYQIPGLDRIYSPKTPKTQRRRIAKDRCRLLPRRDASVFSVPNGVHKNLKSVGRPGWHHMLQHKESRDGFPERVFHRSERLFGHVKLPLLSVLELHRTSPFDQSRQSCRYALSPSMKIRAFTCNKRTRRSTTALTWNCRNAASLC